MAHLWRLMSESGEWTPLPLDGDAFTLDNDGPSRVPELLSARGAPLGLRRVGDHEFDRLVGELAAPITEQRFRVVIHEPDDARRIDNENCVSG